MIFGSSINVLSGRRINPIIGANAGDIFGSVDVGVSSQGSVPQSIIAFLESNDYEDAIRNAISLGGDADTMACIAGGIADAFDGGVPIAIRDRAMDLLDEGLQIVVADFVGKYCLP